MRHNFLLALLLAMPVYINAQTAKDLFAALPDSLLPALTLNDRLDCIDFIENGLTNEVTTRFGGKTRLTQLTPTMLRLQLSEHSDFQLALLRSADSTVVAIAHSVSIDGAWDTAVRTYTTRWTPLPSEPFITVPPVSQFMPQPADMSDTDYQNRLALTDQPLIRIEFVANEQTPDASPSMHFTLSSTNAADSQYKEKCQPLIREL